MSGTTRSMALIIGAKTTTHAKVEQRGSLPLSGREEVLWLGAASLSTVYMFGRRNRFRKLKRSGARVSCGRWSAGSRCGAILVRGDHPPSAPLLPGSLL